MAIKRYEMPCGALYVNEGDTICNFYYKGELVKLLPKQSKFLGGSQQDLVHYLLYPGFWESRHKFDEMRKKHEHIDLLLDLSLTDRLGDSLMLTLVSKAYKESYETDIDIDVLAHPSMVAAWENNPHVRDVFTEKPDRTYALTVDLNKLEIKSGGKDQAKCSELILQKAGHYTVNKTPVYVVSEEERGFAKMILADMPRPIVGVSFESTTKLREYPHMDELVKCLRKTASVVALDERSGDDGSFVFSYREMAAIMAECDLVIASDSGALHLAGALKKRVVGLFGHTVGKTIMEDYEHAIAIQGSACALGKHPCWWDTPCLESKSYQEAERLGKTPECLTALTPDEVMSQIYGSLQRKRKVMVVMLTYNLIIWTKVALESIRSWHDYEIMVVDNESTDGTQDYLKAKGINFVSKRCGVAAAQNIAFREFLKGDADYVLLLNNDVVLHYDTIDSLVRTMEADQSLSAVTSTESQNIAPWMIDTAKGSRGLTDIIDIGPGAYSCTLFRRNIVESIGLFDEHFTPRYIEDNDYTLRLRLAGGKFAKSAESIYYHVLGAVVNTIEEEKKHRDRHWVKNIAYYIEKWGIHPHKPQALEVLGAEHRKGELVRQIDEALTRKDCASVLINRNMGGMGDIIFSTILARELKRKYGDHVAVYYNVPDLYRPIIKRYAYIEQKELGGRPDAMLDITDTEFRHEWQEVAATGVIQSARTEFYLTLAGLPIDDIQPDYFVTDEEAAWAEEYWNKLPFAKRVVLVKTGSNKLKNWHGMDELEQRLRAAGCTVVVSEAAGVDFFQLAALISKADLVISPDSGPSNVAGALNVPVMTLFSNRNGQVFTKMFQLMMAIQGHCSHTVLGFCDYKVPCAGTEGPYRPKENELGEPDCFKALTVDDVWSMVKEML